jgi:hypothetical protein
MTWAPEETQKAVYKALVEDVQLATLLGAYTPPVAPAVVGTIVQKVFSDVPQNFSYPYITISVLPMLDRGSHTHEGFEAEIQVTVWTREPNKGNKQCYQIQARVDSLLHKQTLCVVGWNNILCRRTFIDILTEGDSITKQGVQRFRFYLGQK